MTKARVTMLWTITFLVAVALLEVVSYIALYMVEGIRHGTVLELFIDRHFAAITRANARKFGEGLYDPDLGWDYEPLSHYENINRAGDPYRMSWDATGAREDGLFGYELFMATYGDSFTAGEEVDNNETWQYYLSRRVGKRAVNFGTSGYGTDQALMKLEQHLQKYDVAPYTVLAIFDENIKRIINSFRPFYRPEDGFTLGFKPRFYCSFSLVVEPNPLMSFNEDPIKLRQLAETLINVDAYARKKLRLSFPYSFRLVSLLIEFIKVRIGVGSWLVPGSLDLWSTPDTTHLMQCILDEFVDLCRQYHTVPVILFIPGAGHEDLPPYAQFVRQLKGKHQDTIIVDVATQEFDRSRFRVTPNGGHTSPYGNEIIANALVEALGL